MPGGSADRVPGAGRTSRGAAVRDPAYTVPMAPRLRPAVPDDAGAIGAVHVASWRAAYRGLVPQDFLDALSEAERARRWRERLEVGQERSIWVAEEGGRVVGFHSAGPGRDEDAGGDRELYALYVVEEAWGGGAGPALLDAFLEQAGASRAPRATLWVMEGNARARRFYERAGFATDGARRVTDRAGVTIAEVRYALSLPRAP